MEKHYSSSGWAAALDPGGAGTAGAGAVPAWLEPLGLAIYDPDVGFEAWAAPNLKPEGPGPAGVDSRGGT